LDRVVSGWAGAISHAPEMGVNPAGQILPPLPHFPVLAFLMLLPRFVPQPLGLADRLDFTVDLGERGILGHVRSEIVRHDLPIPTAILAGGFGPAFLGGVGRFGGVNRSGVNRVARLGDR
jgi:hypothetical protein